MPTDLAAPPAGLSATAFSSLFQAVSGLRNGRALAALVGCTAAGILVAGLLILAAGAPGFFVSLLATLVYVAAVGTGVNAAGLLHMDDARGVARRSMVDALSQGLLCIPKLIVLGLAFVAVEIVVFIAIAVIFLVCRIPFLGPLLFALAFPASAVVAGLSVAGFFLCMALSLPAIWQGASLARALAQTLAVARSRLIEAVLLLIVVGILSFAVSLIVFGVLMSGLLPVVGLSTSIVGFGGGGDFGSMAGMLQGYGGGHALAGFIGGALLWAAAGSLVAQVWLLGLCLVYLRVTEGLETSAGETTLRDALDDTGRRAAELAEQARSAFRGESPAGEAAMPAATAFEHPVDVGVPPAPVASPWEEEEPVLDITAPPAAFVAPVAPSWPPDPAGDADIALPLPDRLPLPVATPHDAPPAYQAPPAAGPVSPPPAAPAPTICSQCLSAVSGDDVFCGTCGYRLR